MTRHRLDWFSLVSGIVLTTIAVLALTGISTDVARWAGPASLIGIGVLVLAAVVAGSREGTQVDDTGSGPTSAQVRQATRAEVEAADHSGLGDETVGSEREGDAG